MDRWIVIGWWLDGHGWMCMDVDGWSLVQVWSRVTFAGGLRPPDPPPGELRPPGPPGGMAWVRPSMGIMCGPLGKYHFFVKMVFFFTVCPLRRSNCLQITKNNF